LKHQSTKQKMHIFLYPFSINFKK